MNNISHDLMVEEVVCVYLANILIFTKTLEEHHHIIYLVLECLHQHQLYLKPESAHLNRPRWNTSSLSSCSEQQRWTW